MHQLRKNCYADLESIEKIAKISFEKSYQGQSDRKMGLKVVGNEK
jgi:hypothetical protein